MRILALRAKGFRYFCEVSAGWVVPTVDAASAESACAKCSGSSFPRFSARRSIPAAARPERKNFGATFASSTSERVARGNDVNAPSSLRYSEKLGVEDSPSQAVPEFSQARRDDREVLALGGTVKPWNVLHHDPPRPQFGHDPSELKPEAAALTAKSRAFTSD